MNRRHTTSHMELPEDDIVDLVAVDVAVTGGRPVALTPTEQQMAARRIIDAGGSRAAIARHLHITQTKADRLFFAITTAPAA